MARIASIDYGLARIGLAITDDRKIIAQSLGMIRAEKKAKDSAKKVALELKRYELEEVIVGLPLHFSGKEGFLADEVRAFIKHLQEEISCPITPFEERLTTVQAERALREANLSRKKRTPLVDGVAAALLLQNYLELKNFKSSQAICDPSI